MNLKAIIISIERLSDAQLASAATDAQSRMKDAKLSRAERHEAYIRHLLLFNAANERQWQQTHVGNK